MVNGILSIYVAHITNTQRLEQMVEAPNPNVYLETVKKPRTRTRAHCKLGVPEWQVFEWGNSRLGYWRIAGSPILNRAIDNKKLALAGYYDFLAWYESLRKLHLCY